MTADEIESVTAHEVINSNISEREQNQDRIPVKRHPERRENGGNSRKEKNIHDTCQATV